MRTFARIAMLSAVLAFGPPLLTGCGASTGVYVGVVVPGPYGVYPVGAPGVYGRPPAVYSPRGQGPAPAQSETYTRAEPSQGGATGCDGESTAIGEECVVSGDEASQRQPKE